MWSARPASSSGPDVSGPLPCTDTEQSHAMVFIMQSWVDEGRDMTPAGTYCGHVMLSRMSQPSPVKHSGAPSSVL